MHLIWFEIEKKTSEIKTLLSSKWWVQLILSNLASKSRQEIAHSSWNDKRELLDIRVPQNLTYPKTWEFNLQMYS